MYKFAVHKEWILPLILYRSKTSVAQMVSGYSYTTLGLLAAVITILFTFTEKQSFQRYTRRGYLRVFLSLYFVTILSIVATSFLALYNYSARSTTDAFGAMMVLFTTNVFQTLLIIGTISLVVRRALVSK